MFTGLIENVGRIKQVIPRGNYRGLVIASEPPFAGLVIGESISVSGVCLTVTSFDASTFTAEASQETIRLTTLGTLAAGTRVNLERALRADGRLGGHLVSGHIDCTLTVRQARTVGRSLNLGIDLPGDLARYVIDKGSIALDGVSLTVSNLEKGIFWVNLIPETQRRTTLEQCRVGDRVNVEFDLVGKYIVAFLERGERPAGVSMESLKKMGY